MKSLFVWVKIILFTLKISLRASVTMNLGNKVRYKGKVFEVSNGVCAPGAWSLVRGYPTIKEINGVFVAVPSTIPHEYVEYAYRSEITWYPTPRNMWRSFTGRWLWAKDCWWSIWHSEGMR